MGTTRPGTDVTEFGGLQIAFDDQVLRPRGWTLAQSRWMAELEPDAPAGRVLELFTGVGHIGLAAVASSTREIVLVDLNPAACALARSNADAAGMADRVEVREGRVDDVVAEHETFALIIADPPWVPSAGIVEFPDDPPIAIDGGSDGLDLARTACAVIHRHLAEGGAAVLQVGTVEQVAALDDYLADVLDSAIHVVETRPHDRGVLALLRR